ncbi:histone protein [Kitasatospora camelliae]|uniref:Histone protein n=1 Tax=Kitasatospora camelliae TaxID=3156397 RepID=A0AAU8K8F0_9ACTN
MNTTTKVALGVAVAGGYVLGRMKKGRLAFAVATYIAGRRVGLDPRQLATEGLKKLGEVPQVADLSKQVKGEFLETGKKALAAAANRRVSELADSLHERTLNIGKPKPADEEPDEPEGDDQEEPEDEGPEDEVEEEPEDEDEEVPEDEPSEETEEPEDEDQEEPPRKRAARRGAATSGDRAGRTARSAPGAQPEPERKPAKKAPARKSTTAAKKAPAKTPPAKRSTSRTGSAKAPGKKTADPKAAAPGKKTAAKKTAAKKTASGTSATRSSRRR